MAYATDKMEGAEKLIRNIVVNSYIGRALEICRWLLSFNEQESHKKSATKHLKKDPSEASRFTTPIRAASSVFPCRPDFSRL